MTDKEFEIFHGSGYWEDRGVWVLDLETCLQIINDEKQKALKNMESPRVIDRPLHEDLKDVLSRIQKMESEGKWRDYMHDAKNGPLITKLWSYCR